MRLRTIHTYAAFAALGLTAAAVAVALTPSAPADTVLAGHGGSKLLLSGSAGPLPLATSTAERLDSEHSDLELSGLSALAAERDLADQQAGDATALLETIKAARAGAVELSTRSAERARILSAPPRELGQFLAAERGFSGEQWSCLDSLWQRESNWNPYAQNSSSGAYGIPQSLPGSKMATVAADWRTNPATQITWGLNYIVDRYGTPCGAWNHSQGYGWY